MASVVSQCWLHTEHSNCDDHCGNAQGALHRSRVPQRRIIAPRAPGKMTSRRALSLIHHAFLQCLFSVPYDPHESIVNEILRDSAEIGDATVHKYAEPVPNRVKKLATRPPHRCRVISICTLEV